MGMPSWVQTYAASIQLGPDSGTLGAGLLAIYIGG